VDFSLVL